jgi:hypothetical protein
MGAANVIRVLISAGADPDAQNNYGVRPPSLAESVDNYDLRKFLT